MQDWWFWNVLHRLYWHAGQRDRGVHGRGPLLVVMGDSLTSPQSGFMFPWQAWPRYVGRQGFRTVNLGVGGNTTAHMSRRVDQFLSHGQPEIGVVFAGSVDAERGIPHEQIERNISFMLEWLREHGVSKIVLVGPGTLNLPQVPEYLVQDVPDWFEAIDAVRPLLRDIAARHDARFVDLAQFFRDRIARGKDPDFTRVPYRASRSWHACTTDGHLNAYGQRLIAEAFVAAIGDWLPARPRRRARTRPKPLPTDAR